MPDMPGLAILIAKHKKPMDKDMPDDEPMMDEAEGDHSEKETQLAVLKAFKKALMADDDEAALTSFKDLCELCSHDEEGGDNAD